MDPIQMQELLLNPLRPLDEAAKTITTALTHANIRHGFIGGYATSLIGGGRFTNDIDIIVDAEPNDARDVVLQAHSGFSISPSNKLILAGEVEGIVIELLRGGADRQLKLPDASVVPLLSIDCPERTDEISIPIISPSVLVLTKTKRWATMAESTRPQSIQKARNDFHDIEVLLSWLAEKNTHIDFEAYRAKPKNDLLPGIIKLYEMHATIRPLLEATLGKNDLVLISN